MVVIIMENHSKQFFSSLSFQITISLTCIVQRTNGIVRRCLNLGSYNYLGFAENSSAVTKEVQRAVSQNLVSCCSPRSILGKKTKEILIIFLKKFFFVFRFS